ncbi:G-protein coupled receptor 4-like [Engraulis encrasicolus]|uniref:G-protein coupled receptor 4-like n=1 Tax=Engraulis encrasicolus TaxID=184585 RepID=UPI002FD33425
MEVNSIENHSHHLEERRHGDACGMDFAQDGEFLPALYGIFFIVGTPINIVALFGLYKLVKAENVLPVYVINLLIADLLYLLTLPMWMDYYAHHHHWRFGPVACQISSMIFYISLYASVFFMCIIALERHMAIARPLNFRFLSQLKFARWFALATWVVIALPPSIAWVKFFPQHNNYTLCIERFPAESGFIVYRLVTLLLTFVVPLAFIFTLHVKTMSSLMALRALPSEEKTRIKSLLRLLLVTFVVVLGPYHVTGCIKYLGLLLRSDRCAWERAVFLPYQLGRGLLVVNGLLDPVFYIFLRTDFRSVAAQYMPCLRVVTEGLGQGKASREGPPQPMEQCTSSANGCREAASSSQATPS